MRFQSKVVWITGASSGMGEATAYRFAAEGAMLVLTSRNEEQLCLVAEKCRQCGALDVKVLPADLADVESANALAENAWNAFGKIDIFFCNAGVSQRSNTIDTQLNVVDKIMNVNYFAPVRISKVLLPKMISNGGGQIAVTTSIAGKFGFPLRSIYSSSKFALYGFFETVRAEYFSKNIRVTFVCPGRVKTNISLYALEKDGTPHGKMDDGQAGGISSEKAAKKIVNAIYREKNEVLVGGKELIMVYIKRFFPNLAAKIARNIKST
ncbi:MAG: SDR family oxidoreductase [Bacteroidales bacterium]|nr:SDR family oxidoreductase [Bacteroidales bacterium]